METMQAFKLRPTELTPEVVFNSTKNVYLISGKSLMPDPDNFYKPILEAFEVFTSIPPKEITFVFSIDYFNIPSLKRVMFILYRLKDLKDNGSDVKLKWNYSNSDALEMGEMAEKMLGLNVTYSELKSEEVEQVA
jgi:hypothetical protein